MQLYLEEEEEKMRLKEQEQLEKKIRHRMELMKDAVEHQELRKQQDIKRQQEEEIFRKQITEQLEREAKVDQMNIQKARYAM